MLSETLTEGLERYRIGPKIRALRQKKGLGLVELGRHTGLSAAMLSKIERSQLFPTLPTLLRIALVFGVGLDHFFSDDGNATFAVVRRGERVRLPDRADTESPSYYFESLDFPVADRKMDAYFAEFPPSAPRSSPHSHEGAEFVYVLSGRLLIGVEGVDTVLDAGDSMYFDSGRPHTYARQGRAACTALVVVATA